MSCAFLSDASSTMRRARASASSSGLALALGTGLRRRGRPERIGVGSGSSAWSATTSGSVFLRGIELMFADVRLDCRGHEIADRLAGGDAGANVGRRVAQVAGLEHAESTLPAGEMSGE